MVDYEANQIAVKRNQVVNRRAKEMKKILPYGNRIIVKRRPVGKSLGSGILVAADQTADRLTEIADVIAVPDHTLADKELIENAETIINSLSKMAQDGDAKSLESLLQFNEYLKLKTIKVGDVLMVGRYTGIEFTVGETSEELSITDYDGIRGLILEKK